MKQWTSCTFQSTAGQDQLAFRLLGGTMDHLGSTCDVSAPQPTLLCGCSAPTSLLGRNHTVVEMGANDGLRMSNSYFFSKTLGWNALLVEANPDVYARISEHRPDDQRSNTLVGNPSHFTNGAATFYSFYRQPGQTKQTVGLDWETGLSGIANPNGTNTALLNEASARKAAKRYGVSFRKHKLDVVRFSTLLRRYGITTIDLLFLDVEGAEYGALSTLNHLKNPVRILYVERPGPRALRLLKERGFHDLHISFDSGGDRVFYNGAYNDGAI